MLKKILILLVLLYSFFSLNNWFAQDCTNWKCDISKSTFEINVNDISPGTNKTIVPWSTADTLNKTLWTIMQKLMIYLGSCALVVMTLSGMYLMIWDMSEESENLLERGKLMFKAWIYALIAALSSYYMVSLVRYILYS